MHILNSKYHLFTNNSIDILLYFSMCATQGRHGEMMNKIQVGIWLCIAIGLLLFTLFGINSDKILSGKNLVMLIICVLIFYVLARRLYLTRRF